MNRVFYLFRHGETDWNKESRCQGHTNIPLNERGLLQARELAERFLDFPLQIILSSDLDRAHATGIEVAQRKGIPLKLDPRLREMHYGVIEGLVYDEAVKLYGSELWEKFKCFKSENDHACFPNGETRKETRDRFLASLYDFMQTHSETQIGISTHGGILRSIVHSFLPEDYPMIPIPNCVIYKITYHTDLQSFSADPFPL